MSRILASGAVVLALWGATACGESLSCAPGTVLQAGACVVDPKALVCGAGTVLQNGACVVAAADAVVAETVVADSGPVDAGSADQFASDTVAEVVVVDAAADAVADASEEVTTCVPYCIGKSCGPDGCGGQCGKCTGAELPYCDNQTGKCSAVCVPDCVGKNCGGDGCGGSCGTCASGATCHDFGRCVPDTWTCDPQGYDNGALCNCGCGVADLDCAKASAPLQGCGVYEKCDTQGKCVSTIPSTWTCPAATYSAQDACDCACGAPDPDCGIAGLKVNGCAGNATCKGDGTCSACVADCKDKQCGDDGCGGSCGLCSDVTLSACDSGKCVNPCGAKPILCLVNQCGDDGCGGSCGKCGTDEACEKGKCISTLPGPTEASCVGNCGGAALGNCYCTAECVKAGNCCSDYEAVCKCTPQCTAKQCGNDGCGGKCGTCPADKQFCDSKQQCTAACTPKCSGLACGSDGCGGTCGTCATDAVCAWNQQCVPKTWQCDAGTYGDKQVCDCGCGAADPDCAKSGTSVYGCPVGVACKSSGLCDVAACTANGDCKNQWCTGKYYQGQSKFAGACAIPMPEAKAPGFPCTFDLQCASNVCAGGLCRLYCKAESDCPPGQACVGVTTESEVGALGFVPVCQAMEGSLGPCKAQADCKSKGQQCIAVADPATLQAKYLCADLPSVAYGASCAAKACPTGHLCAIAKQSYLCTLPCPAGDTDCPAGWTCGATTLHNNATVNPADDPKVPVCVPK